MAEKTEESKDKIVLRYNRNLNEPARRLRETMTDAERWLWANIRLRQINGFQFCRQRPIGNYIVDFFCHRAKLVIEIDGGQHFSGEVMDNDKVRDEFMSSLGLRVLRFSNSDVLANIDGVVECIAERLDGNPPNPPLRKGEVRRQTKLYLQMRDMTETENS